MEVLAPAGSPKGLVAAVKGGCDAVYVAGSVFGPAAPRGGFADGELEGAVGYAHSRGVRAYVAIDTLVKNAEMADAVSYVRFLADIGADAVVIQDLGLLRNILGLPIGIHASERMGIHSREGLEWCAENGVSRAILPRELTLEELGGIVPGSPVGVGVHVQGAMCQGLPGGCLMSSLVVGRSANRGACAQPCRWKFSSGHGSGYLLNNADLFCIDRLGALDGLGVGSAVIEGNARSPAYAYLASKAYSMAVRGESGREYEETLELLKGMFNRGSCGGYLYGNGPVRAGHPDGRGMWLGKAASKGRVIDLGGLGVNPGDGISLFRGDSESGGFRTDAGGRAAVPFDLPDGTYDVYRSYDPRLNAVKNLIGEPPDFKGKRKRPRTEIDMPRVKRGRGAGELSFYVSGIKAAAAVAPYADRIYFDGLDYGGAAGAAGSAELVAVLPRFQPSRHDVPAGMPVMVHGPGQARLYSDRKLYAGYSANAFNSSFPVGFEMVTLSVELSKEEIGDVLEHYPGKVEQMVYGRYELMVTRDPAIPNGFLEDGKGYLFPVYRDAHGLARIINSSDTMLMDELGGLRGMGVDSFGIDLRKRPLPLIEKVAEAFGDGDPDARASLLAMSGGGFNSGHYRSGV